MADLKPSIQCMPNPTSHVLTCTGEAGLTSPVGIAECCLVSAGFAAATKAEWFRRSVPLSVVQFNSIQFFIHTK